MSRLRRLTICLDDLEKVPEDKITIAGNGKRFVSITTWDYDPQNNMQDHDFSVSLTRTEEEKKAGKPIVWLGGGIIVKY